MTTTPDDHLEEFRIEFDGIQLTIATNETRIGQFVKDAYRYMLAATVCASIGDIKVLRVQTGFVLQSRETLNLDGESCEPLLPYLKEEIIVRFMQARPGLLWLHAGAVAQIGKAVLIAGSSGQGKSTIATKFCDRGWQLMSDDVAPIRMDTNEVLPFNQTPFRRIDPGVTMPMDGVGDIPREEVEMSASLLRRSSAPVVGVVFPRFDRGSNATLTRVSQGEGALELLRNSRNIMDHGNAAVARVAAMAKAVPMFQLCYSDAKDAVDAILQTV